MDSVPSTDRGGIGYLPSAAETLMKLVVTGPFGVGKTTLIRTLSEIPTLHTEEAMTQSSTGLDDTAGLPEKTTTTVAIDFGRLTVQDDLVLYMFGTPGQERFIPLWEDIARGALGALVMVDTRRLEDSFAVMDMVEEQGLPYAVAVNRFPDAPAHADEVLRKHLDLDPRTPLVQCDARERRGSIDALIALAEHALNNLPASQEPS
ncbi:MULTISPECIES: ATP/GTP-binding protein [Streptomyces]|uniref:ATP/GTP-binding protein n=1 Tax=Streptomyces glycanivorans TaxID=3033808 RepID=A0ABY9JA63_9ACTN|nr:MULTISPECIES: ATP/GTP-binding protein [unclassified Streptomyces]WSQ76933.1 ATP/GTP-binding protein [Streptomyces sp. NBC_01213]TXS18513.1 ATP-binding protein [Streptomyces sp. wa22]WLQ63551.1 ATP/GTP-binding protein [Streptomyces sp. Alt3]WSQ84261.1 ATP/GTP-binding protein [Streptomyces sp. NBC_01212]WSR09682.1 ATP/GTP-binding protein [Streptomyces sp. NBC_01208]